MYISVISRAVLSAPDVTRTDDVYLHLFAFSRETPRTQLRVMCWGTDHCLRPEESRDAVWGTAKISRMHVYIRRVLLLYCPFPGLESLFLMKKCSSVAPLSIKCPVWIYVEPRDNWNVRNMCMSTITDQWSITELCSAYYTTSFSLNFIFWTSILTTTNYWRSTFPTTMNLRSGILIKTMISRAALLTNNFLK